MMSFIYACGLLMPLAVTMVGFKYSYAMLFGMAAVLAEISRRGKLFRLTSCWPAIAGTIGWIVCNLYWGWQGEDHIFDNKRAFLSCGYGLAAGYCLQLSSRKGRETPVLLAYVCFCLGVAAMSIRIIQVGNVDVEVQQTDGMTTRNLTNFDAVEYFRFFVLANVMMTTVPLTVLGMGLPVLVFMRVRWYILAVAFAACGAGMLVALRMLTRTGVAGAVLAGVIMFFFVALKKGGRLSGIGRWLVPLFASIVMVVGLSMVWQTPEFQTLLDRFNSSGQDSRQQLWSEAWDCLSSRPWGGGMELMGIVPWAHNIIMDYALYNGVAGVIAMGAVYLLGGWNFLRLVLNSAAMNSALVVALATGFLSSLLIGMVSPPDYGMIIYCHVFIGFSTAWLHGEKENQTTKVVVQSNATPPWNVVSPALGSSVKV
jgi:hypothetical protein